MTNAAFINALMEEGTKDDCLQQVIRLWEENCRLNKVITVHIENANKLYERIRFLQQDIEEREHNDDAL